MKNPKRRTLHDFVAELGEKNQPVAAWAKAHGFTKIDVYGVLRGQTKGRRGKARSVLLAMGITPPPLVKVRATPTL